MINKIGYFIDLLAQKPLLLLPVVLILTAVALFLEVFGFIIPFGALVLFFIYVYWSVQEEEEDHA